MIIANDRLLVKSKGNVSAMERYLSPICIIEMRIHQDAFLERPKNLSSVCWHVAMKPVRCKRNIFHANYPRRNMVDARYDCVCINDVISSDLIAQHVKDMGHKRVGYIGAELASRNRFSKLKESIQRHGLTLEDHHVKIGNEAYELCGYLQTAKLLQEDNLPTALITSYDYVAIGAMKMLQEKGFCVPQDFALIGYDNIREAEYLSCPLTTIALPVQQMVSAGVEIMLDRIQKGFKREVRHLLFAPDLIVRESSAIHL